MDTYFIHNNNDNNCFLEADLGENFRAKIYAIKYITHESVNPINLEGSTWEGYDEASSSWVVLNTIGKDQTSTAYNTWFNDENDTNTYRKIRFYDVNQVSQHDCKIAELEIIGYQFYNTDSNIDGVSCDAYVRVNG